MMGFRQRAQAESGQAAVEAAIVLPVILVIVFAIINFAIVWNHWESLTDAVRASARAAATCRFGGDGQQAFDQASGDLPNLGANFTWATAPPPANCGNASGSQVKVEGWYKYSINVMGIVVQDGYLKSATTETVE